MTKLFEKKEVLDTIILLDCSYSMKVTAGKKSKIDHATNLAVHLTKILQSIRHPVGLIAYDEFKVIENISPTNNYNQLFSSLTDIPGQIRTDGYKIKKTDFITDTSIDNKKNHDIFISKVYPYLVKGKRSIKNPLQASGIYEAIRLLLLDNKIKHLIIITDMENNIQSLYRSIALATKKRYNIWLLSSFSPYYNIDKNDLNSQQLIDIYISYSTYENILNKLRKMNVDVVELNPKIEGVNVVEKIRRKRK